MSGPSTSTSPMVCLSDQAQTFWLQWVEAVFPDLDSRAYFVPPVCINRVPMTRQSIAGQDVLVLTQPGPSARAITSGPQPTIVHDSDIRADEAMQRVYLCLQKMFEQNKEVVMCLSQLQFGQYLGEPCYAAAAAQLPLPSSLPPALDRKWRYGDFDILLIHQQYGFVVCEVKSVGSNFKDIRKSQQKEENSIKAKIKDADSQLNKAEAMLLHLVSDVSPNPRITKTIVVPNLTAHQLQQAISRDTHLTQDLCQCLGTSDPANITGLCLCSDQLSDPKTPWDVTSHVLRELGQWWQRVTGAGPDSHMTCQLYKKLVARFCGPATTVTVPCTYPPRLRVKTLSQAVSMTGECYTAQITLFPEQVHLLNQALPRVFLDGPPGTGKTVVMVLMGMEWLRRGHDVRVMSAWYWSEAASAMMHHLLKTVEIKPGATPCGQVHLVQYDFRNTQDTEKALQELSHAANGGPLYVLADESGSNVPRFTDFCEKLLKEVPSLHLWAANCYNGETPGGWARKSLTRALRCPPVASLEVKKDWLVNNRDVMKYTDRGVPHPTHGLPIQRLGHGGEGHSTKSMEDCFACGEQVASFLRTLHVGDTANLPVTNDEPPRLRWKDVLVLCCRSVNNNSGMVEGLRKSGIEVQVMKDEDIGKVATADKDVVWMVEGRRVQGLERKVIVCLKGDNDYVRLYFMSRCTSQLVVVSRR